MDSKHIERDYSAHRKSIVRPYDEYVKLEIFSFNPKHTQTYLRENNTLGKGKNCEATSWKSWSCFKSADKQNDMVITLNYKVKKTGDYRIDLLYEQNDYIHDGKTNTSKDLLGKISITGGYEKNIRFDGENNVIKRHTTFKHLSKGNKKITINVPHNCYFYGAIIRKVLTFVGDNYYGSALGSEEGNMVLTGANLTISDMTKPSELSATVFYDDAFECNDSPSGFYIDYHDECNFYVKTDDGKIKQVFGGYVSSILPDADRTKLTISCADRLIDGQNKYLLDQMRLGGGTTDVKDSGYQEHMYKDFESYPQALQYLCNVHETTLKSNITKSYTVDGESYNKGFTISFGTKKKVKKVPVTNGIATPSKNYVMLRNNPRSTSKQVWTLYSAKANAKKPIEFTDFPYLHITYGMGKPVKKWQTKVTEKVDNAETTAGSQKFTKCGVSADGKYIMAIGLPSAGRDSSSGWTKTVFKRKCPHCGSTDLVWDIDYGEGGYAECRGEYEGGGNEGHIFCRGCDADYSCQGYEHIDGSSYNLEKVSSTVSSSSSEKDKLRSGQMVAVPSTAMEITADDVFTAITKEAFKYKYRLGTSSSYSAMKKSGSGDCWAFSDLIFTHLKKYGVSCKIVEYGTNYADNHRSVLYKDEKNNWVDFPYRKYGWNTRYDNMLNNTSASTSGRTIEKYKGNNISKIKLSTNTTSTQTTTITHTKGYDTSKPFQGYLKITYSINTNQSFKDKKYNLYVKFTYAPTSGNSLMGVKTYWVNNTIKQATLRLENDKTLIDYLRSIHGENRRFFLHSIHMIAPKVKVTKKADGTVEDTDWYKQDKSTDDQSSCKVKLYQITFDGNQGTDPTDLQSCGKSVNSMIKELTDSAGYNVYMSYKTHRKDDQINFRVVNQSKEQYIASEGDNNNILSWNSINYSPVGSLFNMSMQVFKINDKTYKYIDTKDAPSILNYGEQCTLKTNNEVLSQREAYFNATQSDKYNPTQMYTYTITVPNCPNLVLGDLVKVVASAKKLNNLKEVKSLKITFDKSKMPRIRTEIGLDELAPNIQVSKNIRKLRDKAKDSSTEFSSSATPVTEDIYYEWDR